VVCAHARRDFRRRRCRSLLDRTLVSPLAPREFLPNGKRRASPCRRASRQGIPRRHGYRSGPRSRPRASPDRITKRRPVLEDRSASFMCCNRKRHKSLKASRTHPMPATGSANAAGPPAILTQIKRHKRASRYFWIHGRRQLDRRRVTSIAVAATALFGHARHPQTRLPCPGRATHCGHEGPYRSAEKHNRPINWGRT
jgi:hypothetical protein